MPTTIVICYDLNNQVSLSRRVNFIWFMNVEFIIRCVHNSSNRTRFGTCTLFSGTECGGPIRAILRVETGGTYSTCEPACSTCEPAGRPDFLLVVRSNHGGKNFGSTCEFWFYVRTRVFHLRKILGFALDPGWNIAKLRLYPAIL